MADLDQTARLALKLAPTETLAWLLPEVSVDLGFAGWLDTETIPFPGEPSRRCDTVAELTSLSGTAPPWAVVLEVEARPRATMLDRLLEYTARLRRKLRHGPHQRDRYQVAAVLILLTGPPRQVALDLTLPGTDLSLRWCVRVVALSALQAAETMAQIDRGELGRSVLPWVPLMAGGGEAAIVPEWLRLATAESDGQQRSEYAGVARVFADRAGSLPLWQTTLEGMGVWKSTVIEGWRQEGAIQQLRDNVLKVLAVRFPVELPPDLDLAIRHTSDFLELTHLFDLALTASTVEAIRAVAQANGH
jgi:hypothetical protein